MEGQQHRDYSNQTTTLKTLALKSSAVINCGKANCTLGQVLLNPQSKQRACVRAHVLELCVHNFQLREQLTHVVAATAALALRPLGGLLGSQLA